MVLLQLLRYAPRKNDKYCQKYLPILTTFATSRDERVRLYYPEIQMSRDQRNSLTDQHIHEVFFNIPPSLNVLNLQENNNFKGAVCQNMTLKELKLKN